MRPVGLIAANYLREQRWAIILLLVWVLLSGLLAGLGQLELADVLFSFKQQAIYGVAFSAFLAASSIYNERRSRRILAVLAKGIDRAQYLAGLLTGVLLALSIYVVAMGAFGTVLFRAAGISVLHLWELLVLLEVACAMAATVALLFATVFPPIVAVACAAVALGSGMGVSQIGATHSFLPVYTLLDAIMNYASAPHWSAPWAPAIWGLAQAIALWLLASWIFGHRDIAVAVE